MFCTLHVVAKTKPESEKHATWQRYEVIYKSKSYMYARSHHKNLIFMLRFLCFNLFNIEAERQTQLARYPTALESKERKKKAQTCSCISVWLLVFGFEKETFSQFAEVF